MQSSGSSRSVDAIPQHRSFKLGDGKSISLLDSETQFHNMARVPHYKTNVSPYRVQVLDRALAALAILANSSRDCSLAELCPALKLHKSTVHRLMMVLEQHHQPVHRTDRKSTRLNSS